MVLPEQLTERARGIALGASVLVKTGMLRPEDPRKLARAAKASRRWDRTLAGAVAMNAIRHGNATCLIDDEGTLSHAELDERTNRLANALAGRGVGAGNGIGLLCRDNRHFVETLVAASKLGADLLLLNTSFSGPQLRDVLEREGATVLVHDAEFQAMADGAGEQIQRVVGLGDGEVTVEELIAAGDPAEPVPPDAPGRQILLTSGTTGTPKGARRPPSTPYGAVFGYLSRVPLRSHERLFVASPMFHAWGFAHLGLGLALGAEIVIHNRFSPEDTLRLIDTHDVRSIALVPVMAQRIMALPDEVRAKYDTSSVRVIVLGGSAIPGNLAVDLMDEFGDVVHNVYGSTEVAVASVAGPEDLRENPQTAGALLPSIAVKLLDENDQEVPPGEVGRIFVGGQAQFEGYTDGQNKANAHGLMSSGDVGRFDSKGRLSIEGRDDDMIVSGGENVFPHEVEDVIVGLSEVEEAAVIGVDDKDFGQRLCAFVVRADGASIDEDGVRATVKSNLARYKVPRDVVFLDELPRTSTGKVLKRELRAPTGDAQS